MTDPTRALAVPPGPGRCPFCDAPQALPVRVTLTAPERALRRKGLGTMAAAGLVVAALSAAGVTTGLLMIGRALAWVVGFTALPVGLYLRATADQDGARLDATLTRPQGFGQRMRRGLADLLTWGEVSRQEQAHEVQARIRIEQGRRLGTAMAAVGVGGLAALPLLTAVLAAGSSFLTAAAVGVAAGAGVAGLALRERPHKCPDCTQSWLDRTVPLRRLLAGRLSRIVALVESHRADDAAQVAAGTLALVRPRDAGLPSDLHARVQALEACLAAVAGDTARTRSGLEAARGLARDPRLSAHLDDLARALDARGKATTSDLEDEATWIAAALELAEQVESDALETPGAGLDRPVDPARLLPGAVSPDPGAPDGGPPAPGRPARPRA